MRFTTLILTLIFAFVAAARSTADQQPNPTATWPITCYFDELKLHKPVQSAPTKSIWNSIWSSISRNTSAQPLYDAKSSLTYNCNITAARKEDIDGIWVVPHLVYIEPDHIYRQRMSQAQTPDAVPTPAVKARSPFRNFFLILKLLSAFLVFIMIALGLAIAKQTDKEKKVEKEKKRTLNLKAEWRSEWELESRSRELEVQPQEPRSNEEEREADLSDWEVNSVTTLDGECA